MTFILIDQKVQYKAEEEADHRPVEEDEEKLLIGKGWRRAEDFIQGNEREEDGRREEVGEAAATRRGRAESFQNKNESHERGSKKS